MTKKPARLMKSEKYALSPNERLILFYRENPVVAAKDLLGFDMIWLQRIILEEMWTKRFTCLDISRGVGKSFMVAVFSVLRAMLYPDTQIGILTPVYRQVKLYIFEEIKKWYKRSPYFRLSIDGRVHTGTDVCRVLFKNGSFVEGLPVGHDGANIRGRRYHVILADEYAQHDEQILKLVIRPMLNIKIHGRKNQYHIATTPYYKHNHFWPQYLHYIRKCIDEPDDYAIMSFDYRDVNMTKPSKVCPVVPYEVDEEIVDMQKQDMTAEEFSMENLARFPDESTGFFPTKLIDHSCPKKAPGPVNIELKGADKGEYYLGIDVGRVLQGANFACAVGRREQGILKLVNMITLNGGTYQQMTHVVRQLTRDFPISGISIGQGGGGLTLKDLLAEAYIDPKTGERLPPLIDPEDEQHMLIRNGIPIVHMVNETQPLNNFMYATLKSDMEHGRFIMPITTFGESDLPIAVEQAYKEIQRTKTEFMVIDAVPTSTGFRFEVPEGYQKDRVTACVLMNYLVTEKHKKPVMGEIKLAEGFWIQV